MDAPFHPGAAPIAPGRVIGGRYRLVQAIATGGMATVWEAVDDVLARRVAVKILHPHLAHDAQFPARFRREAVAAARLTHPNIVSIYDTCSEANADGTTTDAIVMELVRGTTLRGELDRLGRLEPAAAARTVAEVCDALAAAHAAGIVHRDVKPANVLLSEDGRVLVTDFGIAKAADGLDLTADSTVGTAKYLAPEQVTGAAVDARADVYAAGVVLYECLVGQPPFTADTEAATALARLHHDPRPPRQLRPDLPQWLEAVTLAALARDPGARLPSATTLRDALRGGPAAMRAPAVAPTAAAPPPAPGSDATTVVPAPLPPPPGPAHAAPAAPAAPRRRRRWALWVMGPIVVAAVAVAVVLAIQAGSPDEDRGPIGNGPDTELAVTAAAFDPEGDGTENDDLVANLVDDDADTSWRTECYRTDAFGNLKQGVGFVLELDDPAAIEAVELTTGAGGWSAELYAADSTVDGSPEDEDSGWGEPLDDVTDAGTGEVLRAGGVEAGALLVWFTALPAEPNADCTGEPFGVTVLDAVAG